MGTVFVLWYEGFTYSLSGKISSFSDESGNLIVGSYAAMVYALPVIGGYLADRYLGFRKAVVFGAIMLVLGHLGLAFEGSKAYVDAAGNVVRDGFALDVFFFSLSLIILGVGFLKANISSIVGALYEENDQRRDSGFTIFIWVSTSVRLWRLCFAGILEKPMVGVTDSAQPASVCCLDWLPLFTGKNFCTGRQNPKIKNYYLLLCLARSTENG